MSLGDLLQLWQLGHLELGSQLELGQCGGRYPPDPPGGSVTSGSG